MSSPTPQTTTYWIQQLLMYPGDTLVTISDSTLTLTNPATGQVAVANATPAPLPISRPPGVFGPNNLAGPRKRAGD